MYYFDDFSAITSRQFHRWLSYLPEFRRRQALTFYRYNDSLLCVVAYLLLCYALKEQTGHLLLPEFRYNEHGKPYLKTIPIFLKKPFFNLSHTDRFVACALSEQEIGIDAQKIVEWDPELARNVCSTAELRLFETRWTKSEKDVQFTRLWTLKESYLKAKGTGLAKEPTQIDFSRFLGNDFCPCIQEEGLVFQEQKCSQEIFLTVCRHAEAEEIVWQRLIGQDMDAMIGTS